jgi:pimeloyl-ACP methyl ester carboxylesterase
MKAVRDGRPEADIYVPDMPLAAFSTAKPDAIVVQLLADVDRLWMERHAQRDGQNYKKIVLIGHSLGGLLARKLYVIACGEDRAAAPFEGEYVRGGESVQPRPWAGAVDRLILLAAINRGWTISHHMTLTRAAVSRCGVALARVMALAMRRQPLIFTIRRGAHFITQLRIQWLIMRRNAAGKGGVGGAVTIQLLGSIDDVVSPEDNVDLVCGQDFIYLDVPKSGHMSVVEFAEKVHGDRRREAFARALGASEEELKRESVLPNDDPPSRPRPEVTDVVFVMHGIRDAGYWTQKVARRVEALSRDLKCERVFATETASYGYFPMLPFLMSYTRREKVEWFMDQYVEAVAKYPNAKFSFVGHSNGTYLLARALEEYRCCRFGRVVFAGSVVRTRYGWEKCRERGQVGEVLNYVASADWVVAFFPKAFELLRLQDLGSAGHDGFKGRMQGLEELRFIRGQHSAALAEENWDTIGRFILEGLQENAKEDTPSASVVVRRSPLVVWPGRVAPLVWLLLAGIAIGGAVWLVQSDHWWGHFQLSVPLLLYGWCVWKILTKI